MDYIALNHHLKSADIHVAKESRQLIVCIAGRYAAAAVGVPRSLWSGRRVIPLKPRADGAY